MSNNVKVVVKTDITAWNADQRSRFFKAIEDIDSLEGTPSFKDLAEVPSTGWTLDAWTEAMQGLLDKHFVQATIITEAVKNGTGYIDREAVYRIAGYPADRSLKGFTRPVNRIMQNLVEKGVLPEDAEDLLAPKYDDTVKGYQRALGFQVPLEVVKLLHDHNRGKQEWAL